MWNRKIISNWITFIGICTIAMPGFSQDVITSINNMGPEELYERGFRLNNEQTIDITAIAAHRRDRYNIVSAAWIINVDDRGIVWELTDANSSWKSRKLREYKDSINLPAGNYQLYFSNYLRDYYNEDWNGWKWIFGEKETDFENLIEEFSIEVRGNGSEINRSEMRQLNAEASKKAAISLIARDEEAFLQQGFKLDERTDFVVYALGEGGNDGMYDYGWIMDTKSRERVWVMRYRDSDDAGGSLKNRMVRDNITLPAGEYVAYYVTDDSHTPRDWNALPPYDPDFWGLTLYIRNNNDRNNLSMFEYQDMPEENVIVDLTRMRDDEYASNGFSLKKDTKVRIYALGEGDHGEMYDYGWIVNGDTRDRVWEMRYRKTEHAGGNSKNRLIDEVLVLNKGNYLAYYVTDGSHSYRDWNASPPFDQQKWGMSIIALDQNFKSSDVMEFKRNDAKNVVAQIIEVSDWETRKVQFEIKNDGDYRVYALGEGSEGQMYDYGWIESDQGGRVIWEMTYRKTEHAGGASKNRMFDGPVYLKKGNYVLYYESDDSHSFRDWNSSPPRDPENWGISIFKTGN